MLFTAAELCIVGAHAPLNSLSQGTFDPALGVLQVNRVKFMCYTVALKVSNNTEL